MGIPLGRARGARILVLADYYLPGYRAGGPVKSLRNMACTLGGEYDILVATRDRDLGDSTPYEDVTLGRWIDTDGAKVQYLPPGLRGMLALARILRDTPHDALYLQSVFSWSFTIWPLVLRRLGLVHSRPLLIAARGEFSPGALSLKARKKGAYLEAARISGLYDQAVWQASSKEEEAHVRAQFGADAEVYIAPNIPLFSYGGSPEPKKACSLRVLFLSRISRKKNLDFVLRIIGLVAVRSRVTIIGPVEDEDYWGECRELIGSLPDEISVEVLGPMPPERIEEAYLAHDILFLPTKGENFGWVIAEALAAGCPVLISDQTPWRNLVRRGVGWDLPLSAPLEFVDALRTIYRMTPEEYREMSCRARRWVREVAATDSAINAQRAIFSRILGAGR